jgi:hypothetical protein
MYICLPLYNYIAKVNSMINGNLLLILLDNEPIAVPKFISAQKLLEDKFILEFSSNHKNKKKTRTLELTIGETACFVKLSQIFFVILLSEVYCQSVIMVLNLLLYMY